jgi:hypothetical protein
MIRVIFIMVARKVNPSFSSEGKGRPGMECFTLKRKNRPDMSQSEAPMPKAHPDFPLWTAAYRFFPACIAIFAFIENWASFGLPLHIQKAKAFFYTGLSTSFLTGWVKTR